MRRKLNAVQCTEVTNGLHLFLCLHCRYLHAFEDFYRKLGSTMGTISRPGRSRNNSGRGMGVYKNQVKDQEKLQVSCILLESSGHNFIMNYTKQNAVLLCE